MAVTFGIYNAAVAAGGGNGVAAGLFFPTTEDSTTAIRGVKTSELGDANIEHKIVYGLQYFIHKRISALATPPLAVGVTRGSATVQGNPDAFDLSFGFTFSYASQLVTKTTGLYPLPADETGKLTIASLFPTASLIVAEGAIPGPGVVIPHSRITTMGAAIPADVNNADARDYLNGLILDFVTNLSPGTALTQNAIGNNQAVTQTGNIAATTGLVDADIPLSLFSTRTYTNQWRVLLGQETEGFDLIN